MTSIDDVSFTEVNNVYCLTCFAAESQRCNDGGIVSVTHTDRLERAARFRDFAAREKTDAENDVYATAVCKLATAVEMRRSVGERAKRIRRKWRETDGGNNPYAL